MLASLFIGIALAAPAAPGPLVLRPMPVAKPALKYQLLPEVREMNPGNPVQWYLRCFAEQRNFFFSKQGVDERNRYRAMSLAELAKENITGYGGSALTQADWAARLESPDWDVLQKVKEGRERREAEIGAFRALALSLQVRFRGEIARADWDAAVRTAKTMFGFARHLGESPLLAANLLGLEVANLALDSLEEMIQQPKAPNLYWAFADLPAPLVELKRGFQGERAGVDAELASIRTDAAMTDEELERFVSTFSGRIGFVREQAGRSPKNVRSVIQAMVEDRGRAGRIRNRLLKEQPASGVADKVGALKVLAFPALQLILIDERTDFESRRDEALKLLRLAPSQIDALSKDGPGEGLFADFLPSVVEHRRTQAKVEQRFAMLRILEAIRHHGSIPAKLDDLKLPLPMDPFTGQAFGWSVADGTATLTGARASMNLIIKK